MSISSTVFTMIVLLTGSLTLHSQLPAPPAPEAPATEGTVLHIHVSSVLVPVVVRDAHGHAVGNLKQEDFKLFDQGKRRPIIGFTLRQAETHRNEQPGVQGSISEPLKAANDLGAPLVAPPSTAANRFIVFLFDDRHLGPGNLEQAKKAGIRMLEQPLADTDRAVVLSFLGVNSGMTHDTVPLQAAIAKLKPRQISQHDHSQCPDIDYYTADQILNKHSKTEWDIAYEQAANCAHKVSPFYYQGVLWVDQSTFDVVILRTDLLDALPDLHLTQLTTDLSFRLVRIHGFDAEFWLPNELSISSDQGAGPPEERHRYSDYHLFHSTSSIAQ